MSKLHLFHIHKYISASMQMLRQYLYQPPTDSFQILSHLWFKSHTITQCCTVYSTHSIAK